MDKQASDLNERLLARDYLNGGESDDWPELVNPDGPEAVARLKELEDENAKLQQEANELAEAAGCYRQRAARAQARIAELESALREIGTCTSEHGGAAKSLKIIRAALND